MNIYEYIKIEQYDIEELDISNKKLTEIISSTIVDLAKATKITNEKLKTMINS